MFGCDGEYLRFTGTVTGQGPPLGLGGPRRCRCCTLNLANRIFGSDLK